MTTDIRTDTLRPNELEAVYAISRIVAETIDNEEALDAITKLARMVFIFDNLVIYTVDELGSIEPVFARAIGRGRSTPAEVTWGDAAAKAVIETGENQLSQAKRSMEDTDRLDQHYFLG
jgi:hypothetical protein